MKSMLDIKGHDYLLAGDFNTDFLHQYRSNAPSRCDSEQGNKNIDHIVTNGKVLRIITVPFHSDHMLRIAVSDWRYRNLVSTFKPKGILRSM